MLLQLSGLVKSKIIDIKMHKNFKCEQNPVTFDITFEGEYDDGSIRQATINGVNCPFENVPNIDMETNYDHYPGIFNPCCTPIYEARNYILKNKVSFEECTSKIIKEPDPIDVTMEEIESKFGRKVRIVKEK